MKTESDECPIVVSTDSAVISEHKQRHSGMHGDIYRGNTPEERTRKVRELERFEH